MVNYLIIGSVLAVVISFATGDLIQFTGKCIPCCNFTPIVGFTINDIHPHSNILLVTSNGPLQIKNYTRTATRVNATTTLLKESFQPLGTNLPQTKNTYFYATKKSGVYNFLRQNSLTSYHYTWYRGYVLYSDSSEFLITVICRNLGNNKNEAEIIALSGSGQENITIEQLRIVRDVLKKYGLPGYEYLQVVQRNG